MQRLQLDTPAGRIAALASDGDGPVVFLCHGNSGGADDFAGLLASPLGQRLRLVALDLPGHGASDPASDPARGYSIGGFGDAVEAAIATSGAERYWLVGQSLGGHVLMESLHRLPGARGLVLLSAPPLAAHMLAAAFKPDPTGGALFAAEISREQETLMARAFVNTGDGPLADRIRAGIRATDPRMRECLGASLGAIADERALFDRAAVPVAVVAATDDAFLQGAYYATLPKARMWGGQPIWCEGKPHALQLAAVADVARVVEAMVDATA
ncbi:alpha/beta fold hydrolase [Ramlibacter sp.]|uniref:alpha/beta fold hydrolase n=1 Tax=Ramlibacter sp. TaxID=1917967 RepID=UPI00179FC91F|nr:alpha/beta fold hydrolase [Ramlibacter sp.]MBA2676079.1 alpha/beta fold hydrolase [Ramlibacter sp.]